MSWYNEPRRHSLSARGIKTAVKGKPLAHSPEGKPSAEETKVDAQRRLYREYVSVREDIDSEEHKYNYPQEGDYDEERLDRLYRIKEDIEAEAKERNIKLMPLKGED